MSTFEELSKKTFFSLVDEILSIQDQRVDCMHFISISSHFSAIKQKEIVEAIIEKGESPGSNFCCKRAKKIVIEILIGIYKKNSDAKM